MALKTHRPMTPGTRFRHSLDFSDITKDTPEKSLVSSKNRISGRNVNGRITMRRRGGGHKRKYRMIDFKRDKAGVPGVEMGERIPSAIPEGDAMVECSDPGCAGALFEDGPDEISGEAIRVIGLRPQELESLWPQCVDFNTEAVGANPDQPGPVDLHPHGRAI